jgi:hypothetical protein
MTDLMKDLSEIELTKLDQLNQAQGDSEGIRLPFAAVYVHVKNGDPKAKGQSAVQYFGGWEGDPEKIGELVETGDLPTMPDGWTSYDAVSREGKEYPGIGTRKLVVAVIASRASWLTKDGKSRAPAYSTEFSRLHVQWLGLLLNNQPKYCVPVVFSAKGYQVTNVREAIEKWEKAIRPFRKELNATGLGRYAFWVSLGTAGDKPDFKKVGPPGKQSTITPITALIPDGLTADLVGKRFIGKDALMKCVDMLTQAQEWLGAWKTPSGETNAKPAQQGGAEIRNIQKNADPETGEFEFPADW